LAIDKSGAGVRLSSVSKAYGGATAVDDVTLAVEPGEFLTLLGPSGSGKTTMLMMLAGFVTPDRGDIWIGDERVTYLPPYHRNLGFVFQNYALFPHLTVLGNLAFPLEMRGVRKAEILERVAAALDRVRLPGVEDRYPDQLSGGQQQRIAVARALIFQPPVLLMDEPLSALDKKLRQQMQGELKQMHSELGITFIYVTHDQEEALVMSDRIAVVNAGKVAQVDSPVALYENPLGSFVAGFVGETNLLVGTLHRASSGQLAIAIDENTHIPAPVAAAAALGSSTCIAVRPERVQIAPASLDRAPSETETWHRGEVVDVAYVGEQWRYRVRIGPLSISARKMCSDAPMLPVGSPVDVGWRVQDSRFLGPD
jgi:putative spermidine/putrescine transport system ATP-binding protein